MIQTTRLIRIRVFGIEYNVPIAPNVTNEKAQEALLKTRRILISTIYMYTEVARSYSRDVGDILRKNGFLRKNDTRNYLQRVQRCLDRTSSIMREDADSDFFQNYSDEFYFKLQPDFDYLRQCLDNELSANGVDNHVVLSYTYVLHNIINLAIDAWKSLMEHLTELHGIDLSKPFHNWKPDGAERWCRDLNLSLYGKQGDKLIDENSIEHKQSVFAYERMVDKITSTDAMKQAIRNAET